VASVKNKISLDEETLFWKENRVFVFGVDEAGRGCLAGPVCAAVACWPMHYERLEVAHDIRDSKLINEKRREELFGFVEKETLAHGIGFATAQEIDQWNILRATSLAVARGMERALASLVNVGLIEMGKIRSRDFAFLADGSHPLLLRARNFTISPEFGPELPLLRELMSDDIVEKPIVKGDGKVFSIASASILAKVSRDRLMHSLSERFPAYDFSGHKGYSTQKHMEMLREHGPCAEHRMTFAPVTESIRTLN
jgi:ribonuclease HII